MGLIILIMGLCNFLEMAYGSYSDVGDKSDITHKATWFNAYCVSCIRYA
jgi:hypothetical protein